jgi:hypothetical protein
MENLLKNQINNKEKMIEYLLVTYLERYASFFISDF